MTSKPSDTFGELLGFNLVMGRGEPSGRSFHDVALTRWDRTGYGWGLWWEWDLRKPGTGLLPARSCSSSWMRIRMGRSRRRKCRPRGNSHSNVS